MKKMFTLKKFVSILLTVLMCLSLVSCLDREPVDTSTETADIEESVVFDGSSSESESITDGDVKDSCPGEESRAETETRVELTETETESKNICLEESETLSDSASESEPIGENDSNESLGDITSETERETESETVPETKNEIEGETAGEQTETVNEDDLYLEIECVVPDKYKKQQFFFSNDGFYINTTVPENWAFDKASSNLFNVERNGKIIGTVTKNDGANEQWSIVKKSETSTSSMITVVYVERSGTGESLEFRYRITYAKRAEPDVVLFSMCISYAEISGGTKLRLRNASLSTNFESDPGIGTLKSERAQQSILIIGNSFVNSSAIGTTLRQMCQAGGKNTEVTAISRGYAHVSTYTSDEYFMDEVRSGKYGIIFVCGFYSNDESESLSALWQACKSAGTQLVIFPAHNEPRGCIDLAVSEHSDLAVLDWKQEIDTLIKYGVDKWDMCIDDAHLHSTPLAGFVGAHMIYRAVFGELPKRTDLTAISTSTVIQKLGKYCSTGYISYMEAGAVEFN